MIGMKLFVVIVGLAVAFASYEKCCERKTVGDKSYTLAESGGEVPPMCKSSCVYTQDGDKPSQLFCFAPGYLSVTCHSWWTPTSMPPSSDRTTSTSSEQPTSSVPPITSSLFINGPGHDNVEQKMEHHELLNETHINVPAHGDNIAQQIILQGVGGTHNVQTPLITYVRDGVCHMTELPSGINPQISTQNRELRGGTKQASTKTKNMYLDRSSNEQHIYQLFTNLYEIQEGSEEYEQMSPSVKDNCAGKQMWRSNSETHSAESFESLNSDHIDLDSLGRLSLRKKDDAENRQGSCHTKWNACINGSESSNCWYWDPIETLDVTEQDSGSGQLPAPYMHVSGLTWACVTCHKYTDTCNIQPQPEFPCVCEKLNTADAFAQCFLHDNGYCLPKWDYVDGKCVKNYSYDYYTTRTNTITTITI